MQIKKFEAQTMQEALDAIKRELGPEAVILQTKKNKKGFGLMSKGSIEITAAVSDRAIQKKKVTETQLPQAFRAQVQNYSATKQAQLYDRQYKRHENMDKNLERIAGDLKEEVSFNRAVPKGPNVAEEARAKSSQAKNLEEEVRQLKRMIQELKMNDERGSQSPPIQLGENLDTPALRDAYELLVVQGVERRNAYEMVKKVSFELGPHASSDPDAVLDQIAQEILSAIQVKDFFTDVLTNRGQGPEVVVLVGPSGVGKSTTLAKLASRGIAQHSLKVGLINLDTQKGGALEQMATFARMLNVPFRSVETFEDLELALQDFKNLDLILVDTSGRSHRDMESIASLDRTLRQIPKKRTQLVISATTRDQDLYQIVSRFGLLKPEGMIVSKIDESSSFGSLFNLAMRSKLPYTFFTTGTRVPEDMELASRERVVALCMDL